MKQRRTIVLAIKYYNERYTLHVLYIFAYYISHKCMKTRMHKSA